MKEALSQAGIEYAAVDITSGMLPLKQFLKIRDTNPAFDRMRAEGRIGIPCIVVNRGERVLFDFPGDLEQLKEAEEE